MATSGIPALAALVLSSAAALCHAARAELAECASGNKPTCVPELVRTPHQAGTVSATIMRKRHVVRCSP
mgnify:CR=1 FL=1